MYRRFISLTLILISFVWTAKGQNINSDMPLLVKNNLVLEQKTYHVKNNVLVREGATLTIPAGAELVMHPNTVITIEGSLLIQGAKKNLVSIHGFQEKPLSNGFVISKKHTGIVQISFAHFHHLKKALDAQPGWYRDVLSITNTQFNNIDAYQPSIIISSPNKLDFNKPSNIIFSRNSFLNNKSTIYITNLNDPSGVYEIEDNLILANSSYGSGLEGAITSPFYVVSTDYGSVSNHTIKGNSFFNNYLYDSDHDTIIQELNIGLGGDKDLELPNNYFGNGSENDVLRRIDHYFTNNDAPVLNVSPMLAEATQKTPTHIRKIKVNGQTLQDLNEFDGTNDDNITLEIEFSNEIDSTTSKPEVEYSYYDENNDEILTEKGGAKVVWGSASSVRISMANKIKGTAKKAVWKIRGFVDELGFRIASHSIGHNSFKRFVAGKRRNKGYEGAGPGEIPITMKEFMEVRKMMDSLLNIQNETNENVSKLSGTGPGAPIETKYLTETIELGGFFGTSLYFGDLTDNEFTYANDLDWAVGARLAYNLSPKWTPKVNLYYGKLHGDDKNNKGAHPDRGFAFQSNLLELSAMMEYNLNKFGPSESHRWTPSIGFGLGIFFFDATRQYNYQGQTYTFKLRELGTNGQFADRADVLSDGSLNGYNPYSLCMPLELNIKRIIGKENQWISTFTLGWRFTWTDYIDDVGGYKWATRDEMLSTGQIDQYNKIANRDNIDVNIVQAAALDFWASDNPDIMSDPDSPRGSAAVNDWYFYGGITISRIIPYERKARKQDQ